MKDLGVGLAVFTATLSICLLIRGVSKFVSSRETKVTTTKVDTNSAIARRVIRPLSGVSLVYVAELDTTYKPSDTIVILSPVSGTMIKAVVVR